METQQWWLTFGYAKLKIFVYILQCIQTNLSLAWNSPEGVTDVIQEDFMFESKRFKIWWVLSWTWLLSE